MSSQLASTALCRHAHATMLLCGAFFYMFLGDEEVLLSQQAPLPCAATCRLIAGMLSILQLLAC